MAKSRKLFIVLLLVLVVLTCGCKRSSSIQKKNNKTSMKHEEAKELFRKGLKAHKEGNLEESETFYKQALKLWPSYFEAHNNLGDVHEKKGELEKAIKEYTIASRLNPYLPAPYFGLGDVYLKQGDCERAIKAYEIGLRIYPKDRLSRENLGIAKALMSKILFGFGSYQLTKEALSRLDQVGSALSSQILSKCLFEVQGYTDDIGSTEYNLGLSLRRAQEVKRYLVEEARIPPEKLLVKGYGEEKIISSRYTEEGRANSRRVELKALASTSK